MFGIAIARLDQITEEEKHRYQALYCGLCKSLKARYGQVSRLSLSYDLVFLAMLHNSLYEPDEDAGTFKCIAHPTKQTPFSTSVYTDYAADLSIALAYHKCLDDVADDGSKKAKAARAVLESSYKKASKFIPDKCSAIEQSMIEIRQLEANDNVSADEVAKKFGELLSKLFVCHDDIWLENLSQFGFHLGKFIYLMDAAVDLKDDVEKGSFNPLAALDLSPDEMRVILQNIIGQATIHFERLPLVQDINLMRCVLYSGVWLKFNQTYENTDINNHNESKK